MVGLATEKSPEILRLLGGASFTRLDKLKKLILRAPRNKVKPAGS
jgi:hypothetical protein